MRKILITGATGLIGKKLNILLLKSGWTVHYLTTSQAKLDTTTDNLFGFYWNPTEGEIDERAFDGISVVVHLAGASIAQRWSPINKIKILDSRILTAQLLWNTLARKKMTLTHFIGASAIGCYPSSYTTCYNEGYKGYAEGFLGDVVKQWEAAAIRFKEMGTKVSILRTGIVLDSMEGALPKLIKPVKLGLGAAVGSGKQWQSWIHIDDATRIYYDVVEKEIEGVINTVAPNPVTNKVLTQTIAKRLKKPFFLPPVPKFVLKLLLGEMAAIVLESQKVSPQKIIDNGFVFRYTTIEQAVHELLANA